MASNGPPPKLNDVPALPGVPVRKESSTKQVRKVESAKEVEEMVVTGLVVGCVWGQ